MRARLLQHPEPALCGDCLDRQILQAASPVMSSPQSPCIQLAPAAEPLTLLKVEENWHMACSRPIAASWSSGGMEPGKQARSCSASCPSA